MNMNMNMNMNMINKSAKHRFHITFIDLLPMKRLLLVTISLHEDLSIFPTPVHNQAVLLLAVLSPYLHETISNAIQIVGHTV